MRRIPMLMLAAPLLGACAASTIDSENRDKSALLEGLDSIQIQLDAYCKHVTRAQCRIESCCEGSESEFGACEEEALPQCDRMIQQMRSGGAFGGEGEAAFLKYDQEAVEGFYRAVIRATAELDACELPDERALSKPHFVGVVPLGSSCRPGTCAGGAYCMPNLATRRASCVQPGGQDATCLVGAKSCGTGLYCHPESGFDSPPPSGAPPMGNCKPELSLDSTCEASPQCGSSACGEAKVCVSPPTMDLTAKLFYCGPPES